MKYYILFPKALFFSLNECNDNTQHFKSDQGPFYGGNIYISQFKDYVQLRDVSLFSGGWGVGEGHYFGGRVIIFSLLSGGGSPYFCKVF